MKDGVKLWSEHGCFEVPAPDGVDIRELHIDTKKDEIRAYADGVQICKLDFNTALKALNDEWRTRKVDGESLDDWEWNAETGEVK